MSSMEKEKMKEDISDSPDHKDTKVSYTRFPKDWTAKQVYEYPMARDEEQETNPSPSTGPPMMKRGRSPGWPGVAHQERVGPSRTG